MNNNLPTQSDIEWLTILLQRERDPVEAAKLQKEIEEKSAIVDELFRQKLKEIENDGKRLVGSR
jgi:hypothetical protein